LRDQKFQVDLWKIMITYEEKIVMVPYQWYVIEDVTNAEL